MQICEYAKSLSPPINLDITKESIPAEIIISYLRRCTVITFTWMSVMLLYVIDYIGVLFTGKGKPVLNKNGEKVYTADGSTRLGRGFEESTFRKVYHALKTLHKHFQRVSEYKVW